MKADYVEHWGSDLTAVNSARVSMDKESDWEYEWVEVAKREDSDTGSFGSVGYREKRLSDKDAKLINYLAKNKHTSCFEHQGATLRIKVPIFIARQIQRHRTFSYNEVSRRYVDTPPEFFWPDKWRSRAENVKQGSSDEDLSDKYIQGAAYTVKEQAKNAVAIAVRAYTELLDNGVAPELARMILPQNLYTEMYMTGNLRAWSHFLSLRLDAHAQKEVQDVAQQVRDILQPLWPVSMEALMQYDA